jgi:hypothetical protein
MGDDYFVGLHDIQDRKPYEPENKPGPRKVNYKAKQRARAHRKRVQKQRKSMR